MDVHGSEDDFRQDQRQGRKEETMRVCNTDHGNNPRARAACRLTLQCRDAFRAPEPEPQKGARAPFLTYAISESPSRYIVYVYARYARRFLISG